MRIDKRRLLPIALLVCVFFGVGLATWFSVGSEARPTDELPPGIQLYRADVDNVDCIVASIGGSGTIALDCDW